MFVAISDSTLGLFLALYSRITYRAGSICASKYLIQVRCVQHTEIFAQA